MTQELRTSQQKVKLIKKLKNNDNPQYPKVGLTYVRTDIEGEAKQMDALKNAVDWTEAEKSLWKTLQEGVSELVIHKKERVYTTADGKEGKAWDLVALADVSTYKPKEKKEWKKGGNRGGWQADNISAKIGGLIHDAAALLGPGVAVNLGIEAAVKEVGILTRALLMEAYAIEAEAATGAYKHTSDSTTPAADAIPPFSLEEDDFTALAPLPKLEDLDF